MFSGVAMSSVLKVKRCTVIVPKECDGLLMHALIKWGASSRWSVGPNSARVGIETKAIEKTNPTLAKTTIHKNDNGVLWNRFFRFLFFRVNKWYFYLSETVVGIFCFNRRAYNSSRWFCQKEATIINLLDCTWGRCLSVELDYSTINLWFSQYSQYWNALDQSVSHSHYKAGPRNCPHLRGLCEIFSNESFLGSIFVNNLYCH